MQRPLVINALLFPLGADVMIERRPARFFVEGSQIGVARASPHRGRGAVAGVVGLVGVGRVAQVLKGDAAHEDQVRAMRLERRQVLRQRAAAGRCPTALVVDAIAPKDQEHALGGRGQTGGLGQLHLQQRQGGGAEAQALQH